MKKAWCVIFFSSLVFIFSPTVFAVDIPGLEETAQTAGIDQTLTSPELAATQIIQWVLSFVGVLFLVLMIWGGFTWMTAAGNEESIKKARKMVSSAVVGLLIVLSAYAITVYVGTTFGAISNQ